MAPKPLRCENTEENYRLIVPSHPHDSRQLGIVELFRNPLFLRVMPQHGNLRQLVENLLSQERGLYQVPL